jgi:KDO2-lipid IV(A) lauroyltransferase
MGKKSSVIFKASDYTALKFWPTWCIFGLLRLISLLPYRTEILIGRLIGRFVYHVSSSRRKIVDTNLERCFPKKSQAERDRIKFEFYQNIGISLIEMAMCWWWKADKLRPLVEIKGREHLDAVLASGRGAILLSGHYTSLEIGGRLLTLLAPLQAMYRTQRNEMFDSFLYTKRSGYLESVVSRKDTRKLIKGIKNQIPTWYAPDQDFKRERNVFAPFMGIPAATISASSRLAQSSGAAMLPYYPERKKDGTGYILHIDAPLEDFPSGDEFEDASTINQSIEKYVRQFPENYMWLHQRFKTRPPGEAPFYQ